ncbi:DUF1801 domain-containing protein [Saccharospirillum impatiens]|uniref:DUF1801 domain-containing protein n=1 Tax=Saccharospirillum impatiens TaxID=169438 RepID=UPI0004916296|nr:DUF1801 domain-containing protein [Saccharospirillum impatiens]
MSTALKTRENDASVADFLNAAEPAQRREDGWKVLELMQGITGEPPRMWGSSIIGFGHYRYRYASGREGEWMITGFSPRKASLSLYIMAGFSQYESLMAQLGRYKTGKSCLYVNRLTDVDLDILSKVISESVAYMKTTYPVR